MTAEDPAKVSRERTAKQIGWRHRLQRMLARAAAPLWVPLVVCWLRFGLGYRIEGLAEVRQQYRRIRSGSSEPLLICANHLTMIDSFLIGWALAPPWRYLLDFDELPWNVPEAENFAATPWGRALAYFAKCIPIRRGGDRQEVALVLERVVHLLARGEVALLFPEGGRSRSGQVEMDSAAWGVGRVVASHSNCRVLCVYLRGRRQLSWGRFPQRGDRFSVSLRCIEPKSDERGPRRSLELSRQVVAQLVQMERSHFDAR